MRHHPHDLRRLPRELYKMDSLADRVLAGKELVREDFVDHRHQRRVFVVLTA